ncbi:hypothetical protein Hanom_Chr15g01399081 [Helianthus anomalus]
MPSSTAVWMTSIIGSAGLGEPCRGDMPIHPKPIAETSKPCDPSFLLGTTTTSPILSLTLIQY